ncbi:MAG: S8 family serine peptidase [Symbiobacteriia bacterium]
MQGKRAWWGVGVLAALAVLVAIAAWGWRAGGRTTATNEQGSDAQKEENLPPNTITSTWVKSQSHSLRGVQGMDVRTWDFSRLSPSDLQFLSFDSKTQWPDQSHLPPGFQPDAALKAARDPGLGLGELHRQGITGKGVTVAVVDMDMLPEHQELAGRLKYIDAFPDETTNRDPHFHGMATASILAGATVGVAPEAFVYYFAIPDSTTSVQERFMAAVNQILALNATLPADKKIRIVSISWGPNQGDDARQAWLDLVFKARAQGTEVVYSDAPGVKYTCAAVLPERDRNDPDAYDWSAWVMKNFGDRAKLTDTLGVPASWRTTASVAGPGAYVYWSEGGLSWAVPYVAGLLALGLQVNPDATFDDLYQALDKTATANPQGVRMVNPAAYIAAVRR